LTGSPGELGYTVQVRENPRGDGYCDRRARQIVIAERLSPNARVATRIHELAHALVEVDRQTEDPKLGYAEEELVVESVVFSSCQEQTAEHAWR
jgi:Zn-dependent peptidase ImmA (M78 family)